jgi:soluble P-type ATPase
MLARSEGPLPEEGLPPDLAPLALVLLTDEVRPEAGETLAVFAREDVEIKVISRRRRADAAAVARRAGVRNADRYIDVSALPDEDAIRDAATRHSVFGRVTPQEKRLIVRALKEAGHTVAMTGDGVNDIPALKEADCSIAMASGSDAARHVASLVLLDCNFASLPEVVMEGRRVIGNLRRSASLFLTKTVFSFLLSLLSLATGRAIPLSDSADAVFLGGGGHSVVSSGPRAQPRPGGRTVFSLCSLPGAAGGADHRAGRVGAVRLWRVAGLDPGRNGHAGDPLPDGAGPCGAFHRLPAAERPPRDGLYAVGADPLRRAFVLPRLF